MDVFDFDLLFEQDLKRITVLNNELEYSFWDNLFGLSVRFCSGGHLAIALRSRYTVAFRGMVDPDGNVHLLSPVEDRAFFSRYRNGDHIREFDGVVVAVPRLHADCRFEDRKSTRLNSSH